MTVTARDCERAMTEPVYWLGPAGGVWKLCSYSDRPTATLQCVETGERQGGALGSRILDAFVPLAPRNSS